MYELLAVTKRGSWYTINVYDSHQSLGTLKVQGYEKLLQVFKSGLFKHTNGKNITFPNAISTLINKVTVDSTLSDKQAQQQIKQNLPGIF